MSKPRNVKQNNVVKSSASGGSNNQLPTTTGSKRKNRKNISMSIKLEIIRRLEQGETNSSICHEFKLPSSTVSTIRSKKEQIKAFFKNNPAAATSTTESQHQQQQQSQQFYLLSYPPNGGIEEVEGSLHRWINDRSITGAAATTATTKNPGKKSPDSSCNNAAALVANGSSPSSSSSSGVAVPATAAAASLYHHHQHKDWPMDDDDDDVIQLVETIRHPRSHHSSRHRYINSHTAASVDQISSINEPITVITEEESDVDDDDAVAAAASADNEDNFFRNNLESDMTELFWGKVVSSIFAGRTADKTNFTNRPKRLDAKSLALIFKLSETIVNMLEAKDPQRKRFVSFKQNLQEILHPYREIYNRELQSSIRDMLKDNGPIYD